MKDLRKGVAFLPAILLGAMIITALTAALLGTSNLTKRITTSSKATTIGPQCTAVGGSCKSSCDSTTENNLGPKDCLYTQRCCVPKTSVSPTPFGPQCTAVGGSCKSSCDSTTENNLGPKDCLYTQRCCVPKTSVSPTIPPSGLHRCCNQTVGCQGLEACSNDSCGLGEVPVSCDETQLTLTPSPPTQACRCQGGYCSPECSNARVACGTDASLCKSSTPSITPATQACRCQGGYCSPECSNARVACGTDASKCKSTVVTSTPTPVPQGGWDCHYSQSKSPCTSDTDCSVSGKGGPKGESCPRQSCNTTPNTPGYGSCMEITGVGGCSKAACRNNACIEVYSNPQGPNSSCTTEQTTDSCYLNDDCISGSCFGTGTYCPGNGQPCVTGDCSKINKYSQCVAVSGCSWGNSPQAGGGGGCDPNAGSCQGAGKIFVNGQWVTGDCSQLKSKTQCINPNVSGCSWVPQCAPTRPPAAPRVSNPWPKCTTQPRGDANCDGKIDNADFDIWKQEYTSGLGLKADFDHSRKVDLEDFEIWRQNANK